MVCPSNNMLVDNLPKKILWELAIFIVQTNFTFYDTAFVLQWYPTGVVNTHFEYHNSHIITTTLIILTYCNTGSITNFYIQLSS